LDGECKSLSIVMVGVGDLVGAGYNCNMDYK